MVDIRIKIKLSTFEIDNFSEQKRLSRMGVWSVYNFVCSTVTSAGAE